MGIQSRISEYQSQLKRRLRDYHVLTAGTDIEVVRIKTEENKYGDQEIEVIDHGKIVVSLDIPDELPIDRFRSDVTIPAAETENIYLYDVIPITGAARFEDNIEKGDILIYRVWDEMENSLNNKPLVLVLRVSEVLGSISHERLTGRSFYCAPHNVALPQEVQDIILLYNHE